MKDPTKHFVLAAVAYLVLGGVLGNLMILSRFGGDWKGGLLPHSHSYPCDALGLGFHDHIRSGLPHVPRGVSKKALLVALGLGALLDRQCGPLGHGNIFLAQPLTS